MELTSDSSLEETLNAYIADEFFASMQYRMAKVVAKGKALEYSNNIFGDNGDEEDEHFDEIVEYAQSLGIPVQVNLEQMKTNCTTPFVEVFDGDTTAQLVAILIAAEKKAIEGYEIGLRNEGITNEHPELIQFLGEKLNDERGHLKELEDLESNIEADGKVVPQSDLGDDSVGDIGTDVDSMPKSDNVETDSAEDGEHGDGVENDDAEDEEDEEEAEQLESVNAREYTNKLKRSVALGESNPDKMVSQLISYITESKATMFADYGGYFNPSLAKETSQYDSDQCKNKFIEMIDDGILDSKEVLESLINFAGEEDIRDFVKDFGYCGEQTENCIPYNCSSQKLSFSDLFNSVKDR